MTRTLQTESRASAARERHSRPSDAHTRNLVLLWAGQFVNTAGLMMLVPIMPFYLEEMGTKGIAETQAWAGVAIAAPALALTVATPLWGRLGDRIGRKWMVVRALLGLTLAMIVMAMALTPLLLVAGRLLQGTLGGVVEAAAAFAGSTGSDKKRGSSLGKSFSATAAGALAGPIAGGLFVGAGGLRQLMLVIAAASAVLAIACAAGLREPVRGRAHNEQPAHTSDGHRRASAMAVPGAVPLAIAAVGVYFGVYGLIPVFAEQVRAVGVPSGTASVWVGVLHSVMWGATLIGSFWWGKHNDATNRPLRTVALAAGGCAASIAVLSLPLGAIAYIPLRLVQGFCFAALAQSLFLHFSRHAPDERKSSFVSMANSFLLIGQSAGPLLAGPITATMPVAAAVVLMAATCALACLFALGPARREKLAARAADPADDTTGCLPVSGQPERSAQRREGRGDTSARGRRGVDVAPFPGWRIAPHRLRALAGRFATPWDQQAGNRETSAAEAASVLRAWQRSGTIVRDQRPALYAYRQSGPRGFQLGLLAAVHLDSRLLRHEEVIPARVAAITEFLDIGQMNLDPVLLGYRGDGRSSASLTRTMQHVPVADVLTSDGQRHQIWRITDHATQRDISDELGAQPAFIADGHHRYLAARQYRRQIYARGEGSGPWDYLPGLLVDVQRNPMRLAPVHRILPCADAQQALASAATCFRILGLRGGLVDWLRTLKAHARYGPAFVVVTPHEAYLLTRPARDVMAQVLRHVSGPTAAMHVTVLHKALIDTLWHVPDVPGQVAFEPSATGAVRRVRQYGGLAVLLTAPTQADLHGAAADGVRVPRKTTSFGPKPHPGLVLRTLDKRG